MRILVSNDDGVNAPGIRALSDALSTIAQVTTIAPDRNCSGASNSLTLEQPLRVQKLENGFYSVNGTPTDSVHLAINALLTQQPDLVVSGINRGANLGDDVLYSGTVAAATEGRMMGLPAIAISLSGNQPFHYHTAAKVALKLVQNASAYNLSGSTILNVNVPDCPYEDLKGFRVTRLGNRRHAEPVIVDEDPRGQAIYWIGPPGELADAGPGTDFSAIEQGYVSITALSVDMTAHQQLDSTQQWINQLEI
ncbi:5'/3'-nucleotidase SurE [Celerinatantimonas diazotrophica]|uniref:5'-nucleotidase SurE n=1 Tax=Celerinatantimonas diazotrophica TaxID=412034 RepID=A0A4R1J9U9_9GAMM|nr:5'/3'-nucleotidase SurE [Celerinatantimonas diazotrophica]TCK47207.1 5'-nucleotidase /3'-nucleotidase /exopolyphosphatase [Celerinatantimonas diazotrophica]CAG9295979.1 5'-nucleotidase SurE [Celerinatantimonas diazotrophica]